MELYYRNILTNYNIRTGLCAIVDEPLVEIPDQSFNPIRSPPLRFFALTHLILELHYCAFVTFPKK